MINIILKSINTLKREGVKSVYNKTKCRFKAYVLSINIDTKIENQRWLGLKDIYKGKRVFLIGNGPSLNKTPLYLLKNEYKMCFNRFYIMLERLNWEPDLFMTSDNLVLTDLINDFDKIVPRTLYSFFPGIHFRGENYIDKYSKYKNIFWTIQLMGKGFSNKLPKIYPGGSVIYEGLQVLKYLGFSEVYLIGVDMSYSVHKTAKKINKKGIDIESEYNDDPNHFDPRYFGVGRKYHQPEKYVIDNAINDLEYIAKNVHGSDYKITNIGFDSKLSVFPKKAFYDIIKFTDEDNAKIFSELIYKVSYGIYNDVKELDEFKEIEYFDNNNLLEESFRCTMQNATSIISIYIYTHIPIGPYKDMYYFIKR